MSQAYFDTFINLIGEMAVKMAQVYKPGQLTHEDIETFVMEDYELEEEELRREALYNRY